MKKKSAGFFTHLCVYGFSMLVFSSSVCAWDLTFRDSYGDRFSYNKIIETNSTIFFAGKYFKNHSTSCSYLKETGQISLISAYSDGDTFYYTLRRVSDTQWVGVEHWLRDTEYFENIYFELIEGSLGSHMAGKISFPDRGLAMESFVDKHGIPLPRKHRITPSVEAEILRLGALMPISGDVESIGPSYVAALNLAMEDVNRAFTEQGVNKRVEITIEDTHASPGTAFDKMVELNGRGINVFIGPETSASAHVLLEYANQNDILLISSSSTAVSLANAGDNLVRLVIDDSHQARALADYLQQEKISEILMLNRTDIYGSGLADSLANEFETRGGTVFARHEYPRNGRGFEAILEQMRTEIAERSASHGAEAIAVVIILFDEGIDIMRQASAIEEFSNVRWVGTDSLVKSSAIVNDETVAAFTNKTSFTCSSFALTENPYQTSIRTTLTDRLGYEPSTFSFLAYDAVWLAALALNSMESRDVNSIKAALRTQSQTYSGAGGSITFNQADDRSSGAYDFWKVVEANGTHQWQFTTRLQGGEPVEIQQWMVY